MKRYNSCELEELGLNAREIDIVLDVIYPAIYNNRRIDDREFAISNAVDTFEERRIGKGGVGQVKVCKRTNEVLIQIGSVGMKYGYCAVLKRKADGERPQHVIL